MIKVLYNCDVEKNTECNKKNCISKGGSCSLTSKQKYALDATKPRVFMSEPTEEEQDAE